MLPDKTWVTVSHKFNLGNYEAVEYTASITAALDNSENPEEAIDTLFAIANNTIQELIPQSYKKRTPNWKERFTKFGKEVSKEDMSSFDSENE